MTIKDLKYVKINSIYPLYLIIHKVNRYFEKINKTKYQTLSFLLTRAKKKNENYDKLWSKIRYLIRFVTNKSDDYVKKHMKNKFNSDYEKPFKFVTW